MRPELGPTEQSERDDPPEGTVPRRSSARFYAATEWQRSQGLGDREGDAVLLVLTPCLFQSIIYSLSVSVLGAEGIKLDRTLKNRKSESETSSWHCGGCSRQRWGPRKGRKSWTGMGAGRGWVRDDPKKRGRCTGACSPDV